MSLPSVKSPTFTVKIKEIKKPLTIRPMIVAEHKSLQQAMDIGSEIDLMNTIGDVVTACVSNAIDAKKVERHILDYVFIQLYMTSVENVVTSRYVCKNKIKDEDGNIKIDEETGDEVICNTPIDVKIPLERVAIQYPENYEELKVITLSDTVKMHMKSLSLASTIEIENLRSEIYVLAEELGRLVDVPDDVPVDQPRIDVLQDKITAMNQDIQSIYVFHSIDKILDGEVVMTSDDFTIEEFKVWFESLPSKVGNMIDNYIGNQPVVATDIKITCAKCWNSREIKLRGLQDFFS